MVIKLWFIRIFMIAKQSLECAVSAALLNCLKAALTRRTPKDASRQNKLHRTQKKFLCLEFIKVFLSLKIKSIRLLVHFINQYLTKYCQNKTFVLRQLHIIIDNYKQIKEFSQ